MTVNNPSLVLTFLGNDLEEGHNTIQTIDDSWIVNYSIVPQKQLLNGLKSSSDQFSLTIFRKCPSIEDIIATEGNIKAQLYDGDTILFTGFVSTSYSWTVTDHGEQALQLTLESIGTRLFSQPFIETGYYFFDTTASAAIYILINPLGLHIRSGDERKVLQSVRKEVEAGKTVRELIDSLCYECNAVYWFNPSGELCIESITADTTGAQEVDSTHLFNLKGKAVALSKALRTYKGARIRYTETATADNYLVYRNTTGQDTSHPYCNLKLGAGEYYDGAEIYTAAEWSEATADAFREPTLISAVNAGSESSIVGSGKIINISNAAQNVVCDSGITVTIEAVGGKWFKILAHNSSASDKYITRMDLYASIVYEKNFGVIRTQIQGSTDGKSLLEEEMTWIHDKDSAQKHANLLAQYNKSCGASYTFYSDLQIPLGSVIELHDDVFSGLDVFVLVYGFKGFTDSDLREYKAVGISTFDLGEAVYHGTTGSANPSAPQGAQGEPGAAAEIQYAIGSSIINPPMDEMLWGGVEMLWGGETMLWQQGLWTDEVPDMERGKYIWMRTRTGDSPWQYTRLTGSTSWDNENLGVCTTATPTTSKEGLGLIPGDYFIAGAEFTEDGVTYRKGFAYSYNGTGWDVLDLSDADNSGKALQCLSDLMTSGINVTDSTASIYGWFQNLVAQNAVIDQLVAEIAVLKELVVTGDIHNDAIETSKDSQQTSLSSIVTSSATYYINGTAAGTCPQVDSQVIASLLSVGTTICTSGSVVIKGTTYTATPTNPITLYRGSYGSSFNIGQGSSTLCSFRLNGTYNGSLYSGANSHSLIGWYLFSPDTSATIASNTLVLVSSYGQIRTHDILPRDISVDKVGSDDLPFFSGTFKNLYPKDSFLYRWHGTAYVAEIGSANTDYTKAFSYDRQPFIHVRIRVAASTVTANTLEITHAVRDGSNNIDNEVTLRYSNGSLAYVSYNINVSTKIITCRTSYIINGYIQVIVTPLK